MALTTETEDYIAGWKVKAASCQNHNDLDTMFQKFDALYRIYNRLFNEVSVRLRKPQTDKAGATSHVVQYITADTLATMVDGTAETRAAQEQLKDFIRTHTYHFELDGVQHDPDDIKDNMLLARMESTVNKERMEGLLFLIYKVRCNLVHGQKHHNPRQLPLMRAVLPILELLVSKTEQKLRL